MREVVSGKRKQLTKTKINDFRNTMQALQTPENAFGTMDSTWGVLTCDEVIRPPAERKIPLFSQDYISTFLSRS